ncbi:MAG TPA: transcriptional regulator [Candidatus Dormibacteraeota bacterium]|jgi:predicted DNA-binding transcriptional regulator YafY
MTQRYESGEKFLRVIQLFQRLSDTQAGLTTRQLAEQLEVTTRTVQRYISTLRDSAGIDIEEVDGRFRIGSGSRLPAMQLDHYQATELLLAVRAMQQMRTEQEPALVGALAQLARALNVPVVTRYLQSLIAASERRPVRGSRHGVERVIVDSFVRRQSVEVTYRDAEGRQTRRVLRPYFLEPRAESRTLYIFAHDELSGEVRPFRIDRVRDARLLPQTFTVPEDFDIDAVVSGSWGIWQAPGQDDVVLRFDRAIAERAREALWHRGATITERDDGDIEARIAVASEVEMRSWVLGWGGSVEVIEPSSLREHVAATLRRGAQRYPAARNGA